MGEEINEFEKVSYRRRRREGEYIVIEGGRGTGAQWGSCLETGDCGGRQYGTGRGRTGQQMGRGGRQ